MKVLKGLESCASFSLPTVVAIGNFDGLHLGHQKILRCLVERAREAHLYSVVLTFSPHPEKVLGRGSTAMIQTLPQRLAGLRAFGIEAVLVAAFDSTFAALSGREFVERVVVAFLRAREVIVGENFRFGRNRRGDIGALRRFGRRFGFTAHPVAAVVRDGRPVSSSLIRVLLREGKVEKANSLLGRPYEIEGRVIKGASRGKTLGFPTMNIQTDNEITPEGVFATQVKIRGQWHPSVTNIGTRPTFGEAQLQVESFLLGFKGNAYQRRIALRLLKKVRPERRFVTPAALASQIRRDIVAARRYLQVRRQGRKNSISAVS